MQLGRRRGGISHVCRLCVEALQLHWSLWSKESGKLAEKTGKGEGRGGISTVT